MNTIDPHQATPLLEIRKLSVSFQQRDKVAVDGVSFSIEKGSILGLAGASGAGKSSIARAIMGLITADSGEVLFNGEDILQMDSQQLSAARQRIQLIFQNPSAGLSPRRSIEQSLLEPLEYFTIGNKSTRQDKIRQILPTVGLDPDVLRRYPHQFSSGQQQRIAIARALLTDPDLLIADEAVSALDVSVQAQILQLLQKLQTERDIAILFISHDLAVIRQIASEVAIIYRGQLLEHSAADDFFVQPTHPYSKSLLAFAKNEIPEDMTNYDWRLDSNIR
jgi:peptide/nickel transport system ATP-binding protein